MPAGTLRGGEQFQSTLPVWGATVVLGRGREAWGISIHAPRVGSDYSMAANAGETKVFQSTLPVWGATTFRDGDFHGYLFQSTLPVWGATLMIIGTSDT